MKRLRNRDRVARILARSAPGCVVLDTAGMGGVARRLDPGIVPPEWLEYFRTGEFARVFPNDGRAERGVYDRFLPGLPSEAEISDWGVGRIALTSVSGEHAGHRYWHPFESMQTQADVAAFPWPEPRGVTSLESLQAEVTARRETGFTVIGQMSQTILETGYLLCGMERLMAGFYEEPAFVDAVLSHLSSRRADQAERFARAGVDVLRIGDDIATQEGLMVGPELYREWIKPHHARVIAAAHAVNPGLPVLYHSDGDLTMLLDDLVEIGVTAINPVQPECMDVDTVNRRYGNDLTLWGCTAVQSIYFRADAESVKAETRRLLACAARCRGLIIQFINLIPTETTMNNLAVFCREYFDTLAEAARSREDA